MNKNIVLLLTGTINPNNMIMTELQNIEVRKNEYINALRFWLKYTDIPIVFVENSNTDISIHFINEVINGRLEMITFDGNNYDRKLGKGYGELLCLEYAYSFSKFISQCSFIFKVTGRYKVLNFKIFFENYLAEDTINIMADFKWNLSFVDSRFFGFSKVFINDYLINYKSMVNDSEGIYFEHILSKAVLNYIANDHIYRPFVTLPRIEGYSGSTGAKYKSNYFHWLRYKYKYYIKYKSFGLGNLPWI